MNHFDYYPGTPKGRGSSVHFDSSNERFRVAKEQANKPVVAIKTIIELVNRFLASNDMLVINKPRMCLSRLDYSQLQNSYQLVDQRDIVWMKFTADGYLGVVATSDDINYEMPTCESDYHIKDEDGKWAYNTSGIIIHYLKKSWDKKFVLVFPLVNIPKGKTRGDVERGIGNYLIDNGVPILDFYSHNY